jgi:hypothetical protein
MYTGHEKSKAGEVVLLKKSDKQDKHGIKG